MASVRQLTKENRHGKRPWVAEYTDAAGKRHRITPKSGLKRDADVAARKIERDLDDGTHVPKSETVTMVEAVRLYLADCDKQVEYRLMTKSTRATYASGCKRMLKVFAGRMLTDISQLKAQQLIDDTAKSYKPVTVGHTAAQLIRVTEFAVASRLLKVNPIAASRLRYPMREKRAKIPSLAELQQIISASMTRKKNEQEGTRVMRHAMFCLALFGTLRRGEVAGLRWCDVDFEAGVIKVQQSRTSFDGVKTPKTPAGVRRVPMPAILSDALAAIPEPRGEFVLTRRNGLLPSPGNLHLYWYYLSQKAGLSDPPAEGKRFGRPRYRFHDLRHAAASLLIKHGANPLHVSKAMGHAHISTTLGIYGHLFEEDDTIASVSRAAGAGFDATKTRLPGNGRMQAIVKTGEMVLIP